MKGKDSAPQAHEEVGESVDELIFIDLWQFEDNV